MPKFRYLVTSHVCKHRTNDFNEAVALAERCKGKASVIDSVEHKIVWPKTVGKAFDSTFKASVNRRLDKGS